VLVGPGTNMVLGLSKGGSLVVLTGPLDVLSVTTCSHILAPRSSILRARSSWNEGASVGSLISSALVGACRVKCRFVGRLEHSVAHAGRLMAFPVRSNTKVVDSVGIIEESVLLWILLHVAPATWRPAAWHEMQIGIHCHLCVHLIKLTRIDHLIDLLGPRV